MHQDLKIRPVQDIDLPDILGIAKHLGPGFTSLPNDVKVLESRVARSMDSFSEKIDRAARFYLFVLENVKTQKIIGTSAIEADVSHLSPFYNFKHSVLTQPSQILHKKQENEILSFVSDYQGCSELGGLYLDPAFRGNGRGEFLSRSRCLFIAEFMPLFPDVLIAEMRGICDQHGVSPFWDSLGRHFFDMDFQTVDYLRAVKGNFFIAELMPKYPIYIALLSEPARRVIGKAHDKAMPAMHVLKKEGFCFKNYIDILNAGPTIEVAKTDLKTVRDSQTVTVAGFKKKLESKALMILCNTNMDFRATLGTVELTSNGEAMIEETAATILNVSVGDRIRFCYIR